MRVSHVTATTRTGSSMAATMYVMERCRRRTGTSSTTDDVIEPWFVLSRTHYQRILDVALADMTSQSSSVERACATSLSSGRRQGELLRLLSATNDVTGHDVTNSDDSAATDSPVDVDRLTSTRADVTRSPEAVRRLVASDGPGEDMDSLPLPPSSKCLQPLSLVARHSSLGASAAATDIRQHEEDRKTKRSSSTSCGSRDTMKSSQQQQQQQQQPLCLRVPAYHRRRLHDDATLTSGGKRRRAAGTSAIVAETCRRRDTQNVDKDLFDEDNNVSHSRRRRSDILTLSLLAQFVAMKAELLNNTVKYITKHATHENMCM